MLIDVMWEQMCRDLLENNDGVFNILTIENYIILSQAVAGLEFSKVMQGDEKSKVGELGKLIPVNKPDLELMKKLSLEVHDDGMEATNGIFTYNIRELSSEDSNNDSVKA